jgi:hypothetical protein
MINIHDAIIECYPQVVTIRGDIAYDAEENEVAYDLALVTAQAKKDECKEKAKLLLAATDWSQLPDVGLKNSADFVYYRGILRGYATQPVVGPDWPVEPTPVWQ